MCLWYVGYVSVVLYIFGMFWLVARISVQRVSRTRAFRLFPYAVVCSCCVWFVDRVSRMLAPKPNENHRLCVGFVCVLIVSV